MEVLDYKTDIGLIRKVNEDCALAINHPKNKNVKLLIVADGMGGKEEGAIASTFLVESLEKWFNKRTIRELNDSEYVEKALKRQIKLVSNLLIKKYGEDYLGTTITMAIVNKEETVFANVGDSRSYIYKDRKLIQITEDDSDVWYYYKFGGVHKDDLRFFPTNNLINACVGLCKDLCRVSTKIIQNDYDMLLLFSDGVTDLITDKKIKHIIKKSKNEELLGNIINEAVNVDQNLRVPLRLKSKYEARYIVPFKGRDNASGAIYIKDV